MKRTHRLRWQAAAIMTVAALAVAACSSSSSSSSSSGSSSSSSSSALTASAPGITPTTITIGSHQPLTGPAAPGYSEIAPASAAYFAYVNAHGGVYGRKIVYKYLNDAYDPTTTASVVRQLVLQDNVYALFNGLGTPTHLAAISFLNSEKVPDVFVASGCDCWNQPTTYPETFGWQVDYVREGKILGQYVKQHFAGKKVGFFYQDDEFGMDGVKGLNDEIPASMVVSKQSYVATNVNIAPQVAALRASGAQVVVSFSIPAFTALLKLNSLKLGYSPTLVVSNVGSDAITLSGLLEAYAKQGGATVNGNQLTNGIITDDYLPALGTPATAGTRCSRRSTTSTTRRRRWTATCTTARPSPTRSCRRCSRRAGTRPGRTWCRRSKAGSRRVRWSPRSLTPRATTRVSPAPTWASSRMVSGAGGTGADHGHVRVGSDHHLHGNRTAGAGEWHPITVTPHRPSRPA